MHGLVNRALQCFLRDTYGGDVWTDIARRARLDSAGFEPMLHYDDASTDLVIDLACRRLGRSRAILLEDMGTYLVSHPTQERLRRLLRFGGATFFDFVLSLDDLPGRGRLAVPDLELPALRLEDRGGGRFALHVEGQPAGAGAVMVGVLRGMADDYGALALISLAEDQETAARQTVLIELLEHDFAEGRPFHLSGAAVA